MGFHRARSRRLGPLTLAFLALVSVACGTASQGTTEGLVIDVRGGLDGVTEFSVLTPGGTLVFVPDPDGDFAFPLPHLREHILSGIPVIVYWEELPDGSLSAVHVDDAPGSAP